MPNRNKGEGPQIGEMDKCLIILIALILVLSIPLISQELESPPQSNPHIQDGK
jgi:hypothetical protein